MQHNFGTISQIFNGLTTSDTNWKNYWAKVFVFDALIGNTDRHQDNWGLIITIDPKDNMTHTTRISPAFDNGTSMGHELLPSKFTKWSNKRLEKYILDGKHHLKWSLDDKSSIGHIEMLKRIASLFPETQTIMLDCLKMANHETFREILDELVAFDVPVRLTKEREDFMLKLLTLRHQRLLNELEN